ncbi:MAG: 30S ribosomal protein S4 [Mycoplasmoidaceae bacterium]
MSRYTGSIHKKSRRLGFSLLEDDSEFQKYKKRKSAPGQHGSNVRKLSGYGEQLQEKQKMAFLYGLNDRQFRRLFKIAQSMKGPLTLNLFIVLESRLDNMVFRMGFAPTRRSARQLVNHGHVLVNNKKCNIASKIVELNDVVSIIDKSKNLKLIENGLKNPKFGFVAVDEKAIKGTYIRFPNREELPADINEAYVVEWYKRLV